MKLGGTSRIWFVIKSSGGLIPDTKKSHAFVMVPFAPEGGKFMGKR